MNQNKYSSLQAQWDTPPQPYPTNTQPQNGCNYNAFPMSPIHSASPTSPHPTYDTNSQPQSYPAYYNTSSNYPQSSPDGQQMYSSMSPNMSMNYAQPYHPQNIPRPQTCAPQTSYPSHAYSNSYSHSRPSPANPPMVRQRTRSQSQLNQPFRFPILEEEEDSQPHYTAPQTIGISSEYPTSPSRPYSCDLCALSFNRQHDLKRHRETHTGEKPYLCNGGCGKTFTRKDALKRHQLVKSCGKVEDTWN